MSDQRQQLFAGCGRALEECNNYREVRHGGCFGTSTSRDSGRTVLTTMREGGRRLVSKHDGAAGGTPQNRAR